MGQKYRLVPHISIIIGLIARGLGTETGILPSFFFPSGKILYSTLYTLFWEEQFIRDILYSCARVLGSFSISLLAATLLASIIIHSKVIEKLLYPYITFLRYIPVEALLPLIILFLWLGEQSKVWLLIIGTFIPLLSIILNELERIPQEIKDLTHMLKYSRIKKLRRYFAFIAPDLYEHSRVVLWWCRWYVVIAEMIATKYGIWYTIWEAQKYANIPKIYIAILVLGCIWLGIDTIIRATKNKRFPYLRTS